MTPIRRTMHHVRAASALATTRPAYAAGVRAALATVVPLIAGRILGGESGIWMSLAGFNVALADRGGPYSTRARTMGALIVTMAVAVPLASFVHGHLIVALAVTFTFALCCGLLRVWGNASASVGVATLCTYLIAIPIPVAGTEAAFMRAGFIALGGLWAAFLALVVWPLQPYRPLRIAVASCYRALADYADDLAVRALSGTSQDAWILRDETVKVRTEIENARVVLAAMRRSRPGETARGEKLLVLHEISEQIFALVLALTDTIETIPPPERDAASQRALGDALGALSETAAQMADAVEAERVARTVIVGWSGQALRARSPANAGEASLHYRQAAELVDGMTRYATIGGTTVQALNEGKAVRRDRDVVTADEPDARLPVASSLRAILTPDAIVLRHALRVAIVTMVAVLLTESLHLNHGYWLTITVVVIMQPYTGGTTQKALQRVVGTVLGGLITAGLGALIHDPRAILVLSFLFAAVCVALLPVNYAAYSVFLTPTFVLLAESSAGDWHLATVRVTNTLLGGALAFLGARLLWPIAEWKTLPTYLAAALRANRDYIRAAIAHVLGNGSAEDAARLNAARRGIALAAANAEESFQRLLGEHSGPSDTLAAPMTMLTYTRRLASTITALAFARRGADAPLNAAARDALLDIERTVTAVLDELSNAIAARRMPAPLPDLLALSALLARVRAGAPLLGADFERILLQLKTLHDAVARVAKRAGSTHVHLPPSIEPRAPEEPAGAAR